MNIIIGDVFSTVQTNDSRVIGILRNVCQARPDGYQFMPKFKAHRWDGYVSLAKGLRFPTGLLKRVHKALKANNYTDIHVIRNRKTLVPYYEVTSDLLDGIVLRDYQLHAVNALLEAKRGIAKMATNSGKTEVFAAIIKAMSIPKTVVIVNRKELMYQTAERLAERLGISIGMLGDSQRIFGTVIVAMIQTVSMLQEHELKQYFNGNQLVIIDECHHGSAEKMLEVLEKISGYYRYGFSGTPLKDKVLADLKLIAYTGEIVTEVTNEQLIDMGHSAKPQIHIHEITVDWDKAEDISYHDAYARCIVELWLRNEKIIKLAERASGVTLVVVERIEHGIILHKYIPNSMFISGGDSTEDRRLAIDNMRAGLRGTYIATSIFDEGIDVPSIDTLILAAGGKSTIRLLQRIGRGLRKKEGTNQLIVHDFIDDTNDYLYNHSLERINVYEKEGFEIIRE